MHLLTELVESRDKFIVLVLLINSFVSETGVKPLMFTVILNGLKHVTLWLLIPEQLFVVKNWLLLVLPFIVNSVTCAEIKPVVSVTLSNKVAPMELLTTTSEVSIGRPYVLFVTFSAKYHLIVRLFFSTGSSGEFAINEILDLLKLTFSRVLSDAFDVIMISK